MKKQTEQKKYNVQIGVQVGPGGAQMPAKQGGMGGEQGGNVQLPHSAKKKQLLKYSFN